tara:strand:+ start:1406 stop:1837 length:432 start_codon:yes stop_codon:yes gene_type:complete
MGPQPNQLREFKPESFDNHKDPDPYLVWIRDPSEADKRNLIAMQTGVDTASPASNVDLAAMVAWQKKAVEVHVERVEGYSMRGIEITDGKLLAEHGETEIVAEVAYEIFAATSLSEQEKKRSRKRRGCTSAKNQRSSGTVTNA